MGSSSSKPRKGHEKPKHLAKVGSPANQQWEHEEHSSRMFGSTTKVVVITGVGLAALIGWLILSL